MQSTKQVTNKTTKSDAAGIWDDVSPGQDRRQHYRRNHEPSSHHFVCQFKYLRFLFPLFASILRQFEVTVSLRLSTTHLVAAQRALSECWNTLSSQMTVSVSSLRRPHEEFRRSSLHQGSIFCSKINQKIRYLCKKYEKIVNLIFCMV